MIVTVIKLKSKKLKENFPQLFKSIFFGWFYGILSIAASNEKKLT